MSNKFNRESIDLFLGIVRKYMQVRGALSQKDLAEKCSIGVSTMSRFLNQQTKEINPQLIAKIVTELNIPLHEIIDFVEEDYTKDFIRLVKFYRAGIEGALPLEDPIEELSENNKDDLANTLGPHGSAQKNVSGHIKIGGQKRVISYEGGDSDDSFRDKLAGLSSRQKGFLHEFLNLDMEGKDLVVDIGKNIISYLRQKGSTF